MGLLLFLVIVGGIGLVWRFAAAHARPAPVWNPFAQVYEVEPVKVTALDNAYEALEKKHPSKRKQRAF